MTIQDLPTLNAILNGAAAGFLILGRRAIREHQPKTHQKLMLAACLTSTLFLTSYLTYHFKSDLITQYNGKGILRWIYFSILLTHVPLAVLILPFVGMALYYAFKKDYLKHKRITRYLWPTWMYVSITGVLIYLMLYIFPKQLS